MSRWEFDKQIVIDVRKINGNFITILKMQIMDQWHSQEKKNNNYKEKNLCMPFQTLVSEKHKEV